MPVRSLALTLVVLLVVSELHAESADRKVEPRARDGSLEWYDARDLSVEGQAWDDTKADYDRLPARAEGKVRPAVWNLSRHAAGIAVLFETDASEVHARWHLTSSRLAMPHMAATGVSGLDLYVRDSKGQWRWVACGRPTQQQNRVKLVSGIPAVRRTYLLYLPLYNGVSKLEIGLPANRRMMLAPERPEGSRRPIVFYGTSITHGACASRPGMVHTAILGRRFDRPVVNLGFSGNGRMETEVAAFLGEIDAAVFVVDCLPNLSGPDVLARTEPCIRVIRKSHPKVPILLVEDRSYSDAFLVESKRERNRANRAALRSVYERLKRAGDRNLHYLEGQGLLGDDNEGTVDSSHPTDLGFMRQADAFDAVLRPILVGARRDP